MVLNCIRLTFPFDSTNGNAKRRILTSRQLKVIIYPTQAHSALESTLPGTFVLQQWHNKGEVAVTSKKLNLIGIGKECMGPFLMVGETIVSHWTAATCHKLGIVSPGCLRLRVHWPWQGSCNVALGKDNRIKNVKTSALHKQENVDHVAWTHQQSLVDQ